MLLALRVLALLASATLAGFSCTVAGGGHGGRGLWRGDPMGFVSYKNEAGEYTALEYEWDREPFVCPECEQVVHDVNEYAYGHDCEVF